MMQSIRAHLPLIVLAAVSFATIAYLYRELSRAKKALAEPLRLGPPEAAAVDDSDSSPRQSDSAVPPVQPPKLKRVRFDSGSTAGDQAPKPRAGGQTARAGGQTAAASQA